MAKAIPAHEQDLEFPGLRVITVGDSGEPQWPKAGQKMHLWGSGGGKWHEVGSCKRCGLGTCPDCGHWHFNKVTQEYMHCLETRYGDCTCTNWVAPVLDLS